MFEKEAAKAVVANLSEQGRARDHTAKAFDVVPRSVETASKVIQEGVGELVPPCVVPGVAD